VTAEAAQRNLEILAEARVVRLEPTDVIADIELHRLCQSFFWDELIVHAARCAGLRHSVCQDLQAGAVLGDLRIVNPFA
jgi:predicted nucleic acid-binding protein